MSDIKVVISYRDELESIDVDGCELEDIYMIKDKPVFEWFSASTGRDGWKGLLEEIRDFIDDEESGLLFDFDGPEEIKDLFYKCLDSLDIKHTTSQTSTDDFSKIYVDMAKQAEHRGNIADALKHYAKAALKGDKDAIDRARFLIWDLDVDMDYYPKEMKELLLKEAEGGDPSAQVNLGCWYHDAEKNDKEALYWLDKAIDQDYWIAYEIKGNFYFNGWGVEESNRNGFSLYKIAARNGIPEAQYIVGNCYFNGVGTVKNYSLAFKYYKMAAEQGDTDGQYAVGYMLSQGEGVEKNEREAFKWYKKAAEKGNVDSQVAIVEMYCDDVTIISNEEAFKWCKIAAEQEEYGEISTTLARFYLEGIGTEINVENAIKWLNIAADQNDIIGILLLANLYEEGEVVDKNEQEAFRLYMKAAELGSEIGEFNIGYFFENGIGVDADSREAFNWYKKSADNGYVPAQITVGAYYSEEINDNEMAFKYYKKAAEQGNATAQYRLGNMYSDGIGIVQSFSQAIFWFKKAVENGNTDACFMLGNLYENGEGVVADMDIALEWYHKGADSDEPEEYCCYSIAEHYYSLMLEQSDNIKGSDIAKTAALGAIAVFIPVASVVAVPAALSAGSFSTVKSMKKRGKEFVNSKEGQEMIKYYRKAAVRGVEEAEKRLEELKEFM